jgi:glucose/arabinose dehydrogenase
MTLMTLLLFGAGWAHGQAIPDPCTQRNQTRLSQPWMSVDLWLCLEKVIDDPAAGELGFTALAVSTNNTVYAARPRTGEVYALLDTDSDLLPDTPRLLIDGLTLPSGLAYVDGALYISGGAHLYRLPLHPTRLPLETLVDDLPAEGGFWTGGVAVGGGRVYVGVGAPCDACIFDGDQRGVVLSFALDGSDRQIEARGLRFPADLVYDDGVIWVVDSARDGLAHLPDGDELNRFVPDGLPPHFGFPYCVGSSNTPDVFASDGGFDCTDAAAPVATFPAGSQPIGVAAYTERDFAPALRGELLVALRGAHNRLDLPGYRVARVGLDGGVMSFIPADPSPGSLLTAFTVEQMSYRGSGFWVHHPYDVVVNAWGWMYISYGGHIVALRPREQGCVRAAPCYTG